MSAPPRRAAEITATMPERGVQAFCKTMLFIGISFLLWEFYTRLLRHGQEVKYAFRFKLQRDTSIPDFSKPTMRWITAKGVDQEFVGLDARYSCPEMLSSEGEVADCQDVLERES